MKKKIFITMLIIMSILVSSCSNQNLDGDNQNKVETTNMENESEKIDTIRVGSSFTYFPFGYEEEGVKKGFEVDVWEEIGKRTGLKVERVQASFSGLFGLVDKGEIDTIANQIASSPEREDKYYFSDVYCYETLSLMVQKGNPDNINGLDDLLGKKLIVSVGGDEQAAVEEKYPNNEIDIVPIESDVLIQIISGKAPAGIQGAAATLAEIKFNNLPLEIVGEPVVVQESQYPFAKTERGKKLWEMTNEAIQELHEDGTLSELSLKWFGKDISINEFVN